MAAAPGAAADAAESEIGAEITAVGVIKGTPVVALQRRADNIADNAIWLVPYLCLPSDDRGAAGSNHAHVLSIFQVECDVHLAATLTVIPVRVREELKLKREMLWYAAARNLIAAHRGTASGVALSPLTHTFFRFIMQTSNFNPTRKIVNANGVVATKTQLEQLQEATAWFFTMTFAATQPEIRRREAFGWQKHYKFLAAYNKLLSEQNVGAGVGRERGWNDGLDPANDLGPCIVPNNGIDGRLFGAGKLWKSNLWNNDFTRTK